MTLPLSKTLHPHDYAELTEELQTVDRYFTKDREQHPARRWEYAMALRAFETWERANPTLSNQVYDVGGAGSPFWRMIGSWLPRVIDPDDGGMTLDQYLVTCPRLGSAVFCLSVLEHVEDLDRFCYHLACLVAPGGLLFLSYDVCGCGLGVHRDTQAPHHFHWMRQRIFDSVGPEDKFYRWGFTHLGEIDRTYHGPQVYDYSFGTLALVRAR